MSNYAISNPALNPKRVFILQKSEVEKRFDPQFYINRVKIKNAVKLSTIVKVKGGKRIPKGKYYAESPTDFQYLRVSDMKDFGLIDWNGLRYIPEDVYYFLERYKVEKGDVIISIAGTVGKTALIERDIKNTILTENCAILEIRDKSKLLPKYLHILLELSTSKRQIELGFIQTTIPKLGFDKIEQLQLPAIPSIDKQNDIINLYNKSISQKQTNEAEAEKLLASIDDYLLKELGITLPIPPENTLKNRMFMRTFKNIESRLDPHFYLTHFIDIENAIKSSANKVFRLDTIFEINRGGSPRPIHNFITEDENGLNWIKIGDTKNDNKYIYQTADKIIPEGAKYSRKVEVGDFVLSNSMSFGRPYIMKIEGYIHDGWLLFKPKFDEFNADYFHSILSSQLMYKLFKKATIGGVVENLNIDLVKKISIPVPPLAKQKEIADHITGIRNQAQALKDKTKDLLKKASGDIEEILLN